MNLLLKTLLLVGIVLSPVTIDISQAQTPALVPPNQVVYGRTEVIKLIDDIENPKSRKVLINNYFRSDRPKTLSTPEGFQLLKAAIAAEKVGSKRWLYLQKALGIAGLKPNWEGNERQQGFKAYEEILAQQDSLIKSGLGPLLGETIADFLDAIAHPEFNRGIEDGAKAVFPKAFDVHLKLLRKGIFTSFQVDWLRAMMGYPEPLLQPWAEAAVVDPANKNSFGVLRFAALIHEPLRPEQALPIFEKIKPLVANQERGQNSWVDVLDRLGRIPEAKIAAAEMVKVTNAGRYLQIKLAFKTNDLDVLPSLVEQCKKTVISDEDVEPLIFELWNYKVLYFSKALRNKWGAEILSSYLATKNKRNYDADMRARMALSYAYIEMGQLAEARFVLEAGIKLPVPDDVYSKTAHRVMKQQLELINKPSASP